MIAHIILILFFILPFISGMFVVLGIYSTHQILFSILGYAGILITMVIYTAIRNNMNKKQD